MEHSEPIVLFGAGGHGKVITESLECQKRHIMGFLDDVKTGNFFGYPILGTRKDIASLKNRGVLAVVSLGNSDDRAEITDIFLSVGIALSTVIHPSAQIARTAKIGLGTVVMPLATIGPDVDIGIGCIINTGATIDHDCILGDYTHVAPGAHLAGNVHIGRMTHIGIGCSIREGITIGEHVTVGAGAAVVEDLPDGCTAYGVPAKPVNI